jgi:hypothetical protein
MRIYSNYGTLPMLQMARDIIKIHFRSISIYLCATDPILLRNTMRCPQPITSGRACGFVLIVLGMIRKL